MGGRKAKIRERAALRKRQRQVTRDEVTRPSTARHTPGDPNFWQVDEGTGGGPLLVQVPAAPCCHNGRGENHGHKQNHDQNVTHRSRHRIQKSGLSVSCSGSELNSTSAYPPTAEVGHLLSGPLIPRPQKLLPVSATLRPGRVPSRREGSRRASHKQQLSSDNEACPP